MGMTDLPTPTDAVARESAVPIGDPARRQAIDYAGRAVRRLRLSGCADGPLVAERVDDPTQTPAVLVRGADLAAAPAWAAARTTASGLSTTGPARWSRRLSCGNEPADVRVRRRDPEHGVTDRELGDEVLADAVHHGRGERGRTKVNASWVRSTHTCGRTGDARGLLGVSAGGEHRMVPD